MQAYDAELAKGLEGGPAVPDSTASRAGWWEDQAHQGRQTPRAQPDTAAEDEALAHRLQQVCHPPSLASACTILLSIEAVVKHPATSLALLKE